MKRAIVFLAICLADYENAFSQKPGGYFNAGLSLLTPWDNRSHVAAFTAITITPGLWIYQDEKVSLAAACPISVGITFETRVYPGIDIPVLFSLGFGSATGINKKAKMGFILGAGAAYTHVVNYYDISQPEKVNFEFFGYRFNAGISFNADQGNRYIPALVLSFGKPFANTDYYLAGIGIHIIKAGK
jgi:hypothetical protein